MRVGVVCEGIHDFPVLDVLIREILQENGVEGGSCHRLQPKADASSLSGDGGWPKVVAWCQANSGSGLGTYLNAPLFEGEEAFDAIVVHLDGDIAGECATKFGQQLPANPTTAQRYQFLSSMIFAWLKPLGNHRRKIKAAIPVLMTESWMLAGLSTTHHAWETVDAKAALLAEKPFVPGPGKKAIHYVDLSKGLIGKGNDIATKCASFKTFRDELDELF